MLTCKYQQMEIKNHWLNTAKQILSPNCDQRINETDINLIVIHCISLPEGQFNTPFIQQLFTNQLNADDHPDFVEICHLRVSSHLVVQRDGAISQYVPFNQRAWHAGISNYLGRAQCNDFSIGIELEGTIHTPYTDVQYQQLAKIVTCLCHTYPQLNFERMAAHSHIAPERKKDPGKYFKWDKLYRLLHAPSADNGVENDM